MDRDLQEGTQVRRQGELETLLASALEILLPTRPEAATADRDFWHSTTEPEAKKAEFLKAGADHRGKRVTNEQEAACPLICSRRRMSTTALRPAACIWKSMRNW